ncbi:hypothetical protein [Streptomyces sp. NPDC006285]|uniref:hypothetical protein n=1 Tax=Streptomyces sp. NPDC006285 TaxID=3364742 RepID=UPI0036C56603
MTFWAAPVGQDLLSGYAEQAAAARARWTCCCAWTRDSRRPDPSPVSARCSRTSPRRPSPGTAAG